jgi:hypothetical protein
MRRILAFLLMAGCSANGVNGGGDGGGGGGGGGGSNDMGPGETPDMALPLGTMGMRLVSSDYTVPAGTEFYQCQDITVPTDLYIVRITPVSPLGVHHEVLAIDPSNPPDGVSKCGPIGFNWTPLFASGVGSPSLNMPSGVALKVSAGQHIVLNLHLFNAGTMPVSGTAAVDIAVAMDPSGYQLAGVPFVGNVMFSIDSSRTVNGQCTMSNDTHYFAVFPHMHQTGQHIKVWTESASSGATVVWDQDYSFTDQRFGEYPTWMGPSEVDLKMGDKINVTCTYTQDGVGKNFGDSTTDEMCFAISYVYPTIANTIGSPFCVY